MTITLDDLKKNAKFRGLMFLDMAHSAYENHYQSQTYPRLTVIKSGSPHSPKVKQKHYTTYFVDGMECPDLNAVSDDAQLRASSKADGSGSASVGNGYSVAPRTTRGRS